jgi:hypothetical protein
MSHSEPPQRRPGLSGLIPLGALAAIRGLRAAIAWLFRPPRGRRRPLFPSWSNQALWAGLAGAVLIAVAIPLLLIWQAYEPDREGYVAPLQPVPFSHQIHVTGLEIDCRYCHSSVERAAPAGMPSTRTCVPCHNDVWLESEAFAPVRASLVEDLPIPWRRVHDMPDFTYFHHGAHVTSGIGCETCHGRVDQMAVVRQVEPMSMGWCLDCHRKPEPFLRPRSEVTTMGYVPNRPQEELGPELRRQYAVSEMTHCTTCHR